MNHSFRSSHIFILATACSVATFWPTRSGFAQDKDGYQQEFGVATRTLVPTGRNDFFILEPGYRIVLEGEGEKVAITVLNETKAVHGVMTRVVEEREWEDSELKEISRNFFAIDPVTGDVFYFGEDVDMYEKGAVVNHDGAWNANARDAKPGLAMPGKPAVGMKYYMEIAPGVAMDRAELVSVSAKLKTPAGTFTNCLKTLETSAINTSEREYKVYARGIGLIQDAGLKLASHGFVELQK